MRKPVLGYCLALGSCALAFALAAACSSTSAPASPAGSDGGSDTSPPVPDAPHEASPPPDASDAGGGDASEAGPTPLPGTAFAFHQIFLGDTDRDGGNDPVAWKQYGLNLDGKVTTAASTDVCTLQAGAQPSNQADGTGGIDNSWGENILPVIVTIMGNLSQLYNTALGAGVFTTLLNVQGLTGDPAQSDAGAPGQVFLGGVYPGTPSWTTSDSWPVRGDWLADGHTVAGGSISQFSMAHVDLGTWTASPPSDVPFVVGFFGGQVITAVIHHAVVVFDHSSPGKATGGIVGGVLTTSEFVDALHRSFASQFPSLCGSVWDSLASQIVQASDIVSDGTNTMGVPCDGISIGLGFEADQTGPLKDTSPAPPPMPEPCDAGTD